MASKWANAITRAGNDRIFKLAWRRAQRIRAKVEKLTEEFFTDLVLAGVGVSDPPDLGRFTPEWEPLSESWAERKGHDDFFFYRGDLERALLRKQSTKVFGRPQVFLEWKGKSVKVNAGQAAQKYTEDKLYNLKIRVVPFPKITGPGTAEELVAGGNSELYGKLMSLGKNTLFARPLLSPYASWFIHYKIRDAMRSSK